MIVLSSGLSKIVCTASLRFHCEPCDVESSAAMERHCSNFVLSLWPAPASGDEPSSSTRGSIRAQPLRGAKLSLPRPMHVNSAKGRCDSWSMAHAVICMIGTVCTTLLCGVIKTWPTNDVPPSSSSRPRAPASTPRSSRHADPKYCVFTWIFTKIYVFTDSHFSSLASARSSKCSLLEMLAPRIAPRSLRSLVEMRLYTVNRWC